MKILAEPAWDAGDGRRFEATVEWEDVDRPPQRIFFHAVGSGAERYSATADALALACVLPAMEAGERRLRLAGPICPQIPAGLTCAAILFRKWFRRDYRPPAIEAAKGFVAPRAAEPSRSGAFFSGGVSSTFLVLRDRRDLPPDHPGAVRDLLYVFGRDFPSEEDSEGARAVREHLELRLARFARAQNCSLRLVVTNARTLWPDAAFFGDRYQSAYLAAAAQGWRAEFSRASIGPGRDVEHLIPSGTHPLLDRWWSTAALSIRQEDVGLGRFDKMSFLAREPGLIRDLVVCNEGPRGNLPNCGTCLKCVETLTALTAFGVAEFAETFPSSRVEPEMIDTLALAPNPWPSLPDDFGFWRRLEKELGRRGRRDLARAVARRRRAALRRRAPSASGHST